MKMAAVVRRNGELIRSNTHVTVERTKRLMLENHTYAKNLILF